GYVLDEESAAEPLGELLRQDARDDVVWTAWRIGHNQPDRLGGISLRNGGAILRGDAKQGQHYCCNPNDGHCDLPVPALWRLTRTATRSSGCRAAEKRDERAPPHSITSSAIASSPGGTSMPSIRAVWTLMTNSNLVDCSVGRSAGFAPLRILP